MSESNNVTLRISEETVFGVTNVNPIFQTLAYRSSSLKYEPQTVMSDEIRGDDQITDNTLVGYSVSGDLQARLTYGALDTVIGGNFYSSWVTKASTAPTAVTATGFTTTAFAGFPVGALVFAKNFATAANNGLKVVTASAANEVSVAGLVAEAAPPASASITLVGAKGGAGAIAATATGLTGVPVLLGLVAGDWIKIGGSPVGDKFATAACNGFARVSAVNGTTVTLDILPDSWAPDTGAAKTISIFVSERIRNGTTRRGFSIEREYLLDDGASRYEVFAGNIFGQFHLKMQPRQNIEVAFELMGLTATAMSAARTAGATTLPQVTSHLMNTSSNVGRIRLGGTTLRGQSAVTKADLTVNRNLREREGVGSQSATDIRKGRFNVKVDLSAYFTDEVLLNRVRNDEETSYDCLLKSADNSAYVVDIPRGKYSAGSAQAGAIDTDVSLELTFQGLLHPTLGYTMQVSRFNHYQES